MSGNGLQYLNNELLYYFFQIAQKERFVFNYNPYYRKEKVIIQGPLKWWWWRKAPGHCLSVACIGYHTICVSYSWILIVFICVFAFLGSVWAVTLLCFFFSLFTCIFSCCFWNWIAFEFDNFFYLTLFKNFSLYFCSTKI